MKTIEDRERMIKLQDEMQHRRDLNTFIVMVIAAVCVIAVTRFSGCEFQLDDDGVVARHSMEPWPGNQAKE